MGKLEQLLEQLEQLAELGELGRARAAASQQVAMAAPLSDGKELALLVLQPTPFCNLDCRYCYLPDRNSRKRMSMATLEAAIRRTVEADILGEELSIVWHAGEPLVMPRSWYAEAFALVRKIIPASVKIEHHFQTNATLVDTAWCNFLRTHDVRIGVSLDGPAFLHDAGRQTRRGDGTHGQVMRGIARLQEHGIPIHVICVLSRASLDHPDELYDFFIEAGLREVAFNIEERDGINTHSTLEDEAVIPVFSRFFSRIVDRYREDPDRLRIREIDRVVDALFDPRYGRHRDNDQNVLFGIVSVSWDGAISTFSPELLGTSHPAYGTFVFGNVVTNSLSEAAEHPTVRLMDDDIARGVDRCRDLCPYFAFCRGGAPANKLSELGSFDGTMTLFCRLTQMVIVDTVLSALDADLGSYRKA